MFIETQSVRLGGRDHGHFFPPSNDVGGHAYRAKKDGAVVHVLDGVELKASGTFKSGILVEANDVALTVDGYVYSGKWHAVDVMEAERFAVTIGSTGVIEAAT